MRYPPPQQTPYIATYEQTYFRSGKNAKIASNKHVIASNFSNISENEILKELLAINALLLAIFSFFLFFAQIENIFARRWLCKRFIEEADITRHYLPIDCLKVV